MFLFIDAGAPNAGSCSYLICKLVFLFSRLLESLLNTKQPPFSYLGSLNGEVGRIYITLPPKWKCSFSFWGYWQVFKVFLLVSFHLLMIDIRQPPNNCASFLQNDSREPCLPNTCLFKVSNHVWHHFNYPQVHSYASPWRRIKIVQTPHGTNLVKLIEFQRSNLMWL